MKTFYALLIALALPLTAATTSWAQCDCGAAGGGDAGCGAAGGCGCAADPGCCGGGCNKVCKLVKVEREVTATCYGVKYKDICVPGCGSGCTAVACVHCNGQGCSSCCGRDDGACCKVRYPTGTPGCRTKMKAVKHLVKYETTKTVCVYEWRVVCAAPCDPGCGAADPGCGAGCDGGNGCDAGCDGGNGCEAGCDAAHAPSQGNGDSVPMPPTPTPAA